MDRRLVPRAPPGSQGQALLHPGQSARRAQIRQPRPMRCNRHSAKDVERRLASLRAQLLPPLPAGGTPRTADRYVGKPYRIQVRQKGPGSGLEWIAPAAGTVGGGTERFLAADTRTSEGSAISFASRPY